MRYFILLFFSLAYLACQGQYKISKTSIVSPEGRSEKILNLIPIQQNDEYLAIFQSDREQKSIIKATIYDALFKEKNTIKTIEDQVGDQVMVIALKQNSAIAALICEKPIKPGDEIFQNKSDFTLSIIDDQANTIKKNEIIFSKGSKVVGFYWHQETMQYILIAIEPKEAKNSQMTAVILSEDFTEINRSTNAISNSSFDLVQVKSEISFEHKKLFVTALDRKSTWNDAVFMVFDIKLIEMENYGLFGKKDSKLEPTFRKAWNFSTTKNISQAVIDKEFIYFTFDFDNNVAKKGQDIKLCSFLYNRKKYTDRDLKEINISHKDNVKNDFTKSICVDNGQVYVTCDTRSYTDRSDENYYDIEIISVPTTLTEKNIITKSCIKPNQSKSSSGIIKTRNGFYLFGYLIYSEKQNKSFIQKI